MINKILFTSFILTIGITALNAQEITKWNSNFKQDGIEYNQWKLPELVSKDSLATVFVTKGLKKQKLANAFGIATLGIGATAGILLLTDSNRSSDISANELVALFMLLATPLPGILGIIVQFDATKNKRKGISRFNEHYSQIPLKQKELIIGLSSTQNGLGLTVTF